MLPEFRGNRLGRPDQVCHKPFTHIQISLIFAEIASIMRLRQRPPGYPVGSSLSLPTIHILGCASTRVTNAFLVSIRLHNSSSG